MLKICLVGAAGRMGRRITAAVAASGDTRLVAAIEAPGNPSAGQDIGALSEGAPLGVAVSADLTAGVRAADVVIDFSLPVSLEKTVAACREAGKPLVTGITGLKPAEVDWLRQASTVIPLVYAPNMSVGVNVMFKVAAEVAKLLGDSFDVEIVETHHRFKKDAPSGTAKRLAEVIAEALGRDLGKVGCYGREGITGERPGDQIAIHAVRSGDVVGEHTVVFGALGERFEITHKAHSRDMFARGAVLAARFVSAAAPGLYDMQDVLGLKA
ncbi:4-hydroxy-tetrahydrodipicolinate reductase [bacterium]|nr:4-hydroxy-tetrahydrodipicolinate reductase [bacterium]